MKSEKDNTENLVVNIQDYKTSVKDTSQNINTENNLNGLLEFLNNSEDQDLLELRNYFEKHPDTKHKFLKKVEQNLENKLLLHDWYQNNLDRINKAIQSSNELEQMMSNVLDEVLSIFNCDRAFLLYPCDPNTHTWHCPMERTRPEYPGAKEFNLEIPTNKEVAQTFSLLLDSN